MFLRRKIDIFNIYLRWSTFGEEKTKLIFFFVILSYKLHVQRWYKKYILRMQHMTRKDSVSEKLSFNSENIPASLLVTSVQQQLTYIIFSVSVNAYTKTCWKYTCVMNYF